MKRILITGALGQIGSELISFLRKRYGKKNVIASDIKPISKEITNQDGIFEHIDCLDAREIYSVINKYRIDTIFHLAAVLSA
ncbi:MAG: GDP-mannose 4,6-dehydratase, partial [Candidatus Atribacteria bacterium]|nr:GDP-mannose 4,6-dehydratase [Candidatus Atribacteria bacterium]